MKKWVCSVCGSVYEGNTPPELCPVCKVPASKFVDPDAPVVEPEVVMEKIPSELMPVRPEGPERKWVCRVCGHVHVGITPPELCPVCDAPASRYVDPIAPVAEPEVKMETIPAEMQSVKPEGPEKKWVCRVCGHVHVGVTPPELCPVCSAPASRYLDPTAPVADAPVRPKVSEKIFQVDVKGNEKKWVCKVCGHVHVGVMPPEVCPVCKVPASRFVDPDAPVVEEVKDPVTGEIFQVGTKGPERKWVCKVCGHVHIGIMPPELCPVCNVPASKFVDPNAPAEEPELEMEKIPAEMQSVKPEGPEKKWVCKVCGHVHVGVTPPEVCPVCKVPASKFEAKD